MNACFSVALPLGAAKQVVLAVLVAVYEKQKRQKTRKTEKKQS